MTNGIARWVDPRVAQVHLADLKAYLLARGWKLKPFPRPQVLLFEEPDAGGEEPIVQLVPASEQYPDFRRGVIDTITSLSEFEDRHPVDVLNDILRQARPLTAANGPSSAADAVGPIDTEATHSS